jgi:hypothetical protein
VIPLRAYDIVLSVVPKGGFVMGKRKQSKVSGGDVLDHLGQLVFQKIRTALTEVSELDGLPNEIALAAHNIGIFRALKMVNFPLELMGKATPDDIQEFEEFANETSHILVEYCEGLRQWRPYPKN